MQNHFRDKTLPAYGPHALNRYKTLPARPKAPISAHFPHAGRVLYRSHHQQAEQGEESHAPAPHRAPPTHRHPTAPHQRTLPQFRMQFDCMKFQQHPETLQFQRSQFKSRNTPRGIACEIIRSHSAGGWRQGQGGPRDRPLRAIAKRVAISRAGRRPRAHRADLQHCSYPTPRGPPPTSAQSRHTQEQQATRRAASDSQAPSDAPTWRPRPSAQAGARHRRRPGRGPRPRR